LNFFLFSQKEVSVFYSRIPANYQGLFATCQLQEARRLIFIGSILKSKCPLKKEISAGKIIIFNPHYTHSHESS